MSAKAMSKSQRIGRIVLVLVLLGAISMGGFAIFHYLRTSNHWTTAQEALDNGYLVRAEEELKQAVALRPDHLEAYLQLARVTRQMARLEEAEAHLKTYRAHGGEPTDSRYQVERLMLRAQQGNLPALEDQLRNWNCRDDKERQLVLESLVRGSLYYEDLPSAIEYLTLWELIEDKSIQFDFCQGLYRDIGGLDGAATFYKKVLDHDPRRVDARASWASIMVREGEFAAALEELTKPELRAYAGVDVDVHLAECHLQLGNPDKAIEHADKVLARFPDHGGCLLVRGKAEIEKENPKAAVPYFRRAAERSAQRQKGQYQLVRALTLIESPELPEEKRKLDELNRIKDRAGFLRGETRNKATASTDTLSELGRLYIKLGKESYAAGVFYRALRQEPDHQPTHRFLAEHFASKGDMEKARLHRSQIRSDKPEGDEKP